MRIELHGEHVHRTFMQVDGEPWEQPLSSAPDAVTVVEVTRRPQLAVVAAHESAPVLRLPKKGEEPAAVADATAAGGGGGGSSGAAGATGATGAESEA